MQLREAPHYTSLEHFYKNAREYKGLTVPQNYALTYTSGDHKEFLSNENNRTDKSAGHRYNDYFINDEEEYGDPSFKTIDPSPEKVKHRAKKISPLK